MLVIQIPNEFLYPISFQYNYMAQGKVELHKIPTHKLFNFNRPTRFIINRILFISSRNRKRPIASLWKFILFFLLGCNVSMCQYVCVCDVVVVYFAFTVTRTISMCGSSFFILVVL